MPVTVLTKATEAAPGDLRSSQPRALIVTIYGLYAREAGGWLSVAALIRLLAELGVDEPAVRSSISRLKRREILAAQRVDGTAGYALSDAARQILREGDRRIFDRKPATLANGWLLAVFSVPESERQKRHMLRSRLAWLGFGTAAPGVWLAPAHVYDETRHVLERLGLAPYVDLFRADYLAFAGLGESIRHWWDLDGLQERYDEFLAAYTAVHEKWSGRRSRDHGEAFADYVRALTSWRRLPYLDPGLPPELLPSRWHGARAADLFFTMKRQLEEPAHRHVLEVSGRPAERGPR